MSDLLQQLGIEEEPAAATDRGGVGGWHPEPWWAWTIALLALAAAAFIAGGVLLSDARFGTSLRPRGCDTSPLGGLALLVAAGVAAGAALTTSRLRDPAARLAWDPVAFAFALPLPLVGLAATLPGVLGCSIARDIGALDGIGDALVGTAGIAVCAAASVLLGGAFAASAGATRPLEAAPAPPPPDIVELAIEEAEALQADAAAARFHGVESNE